MNIWEALQKTNPVRPQPEMSKTEYKKLVDANTELMNKIKEHQEKIEKLLEENHNLKGSIEILKEENQELKTGRQEMAKELNNRKDEIERLKDELKTESEERDYYQAIVESWE